MIVKEINWRYEIGRRIINYNKDCSIKSDLTIINREIKRNKQGNNIKWYKYHCNKCNWDEGWITEYDLKGEHGCSVCCPTPRLLVQGINDIPTVAPELIQYFQGGYDEAKLYTKTGGGNPNMSRLWKSKK